MKINYFGTPPFLEFFQNGTVLSHGDKAIDCAKLQADIRVTVDICMDTANNLVIGAERPESAVYVANVIIPARQYREQTVTDDAGEPMSDDAGNPQIERIPLPLDMEQVKVNLWTIPVQDTEEEK